MSSLLNSKYINLFSVNKLHISPNGDVIVGDDDGRIYIIDPESLLILKTFQGNHDGPISCFFNLDNNILLSADCYYVVSTLKTWNQINGKLCRTYHGHDNAIWSVIQLQNGIILSGGSDGILMVWNIDSSSSIATIKAHNNGINRIVSLSDGKFSTQSESEIIVWNISISSYNLFFIVYQRISVENICLYSLNGYIKYVLKDNTSIFIQCKRVTCNHIVETHNGNLAIGNDDGSISIYDPKKYKIVKTLHMHNERIDEILQLRDGRLLSFSSDCQIKFSDPNTRWDILRPFLLSIYYAKDHYIFGNNDICRYIAKFI